MTFFGNIPNWLTALKPLFESHYKQLLPGHGPAVEGEQAGRVYFKKMHDYLEDFYGRMLEVKAGRQNPEDVARHMLDRSVRVFRQDAHGAEKHQSLSHRKVVLDGAELILQNVTSLSWASNRIGVIVKRSARSFFCRVVSEKKDFLLRSK